MPAIEQPLSARETKVTLEFVFASVAFEAIFPEERVDSFSEISASDGVIFRLREDRETDRQKSGEGEEVGAIHRVKRIER